MKKMIIIFFILVFSWAVASFTRGIFTTKTNETKDILITAHRGGASLGEENTLECIKRGLAVGSKSIEIDVHLTADNHVIVCHDPTVDRTTNGVGAINDMTLEQIKALWITDNSGKITTEKIPTLQQVLELINGKVELLLEIKHNNGNNNGIENIILNILNQYNAKTYITIQSFDDSVLEKMHALDPSLRLEKLLFGKFIGLPFIFDGSITYFSPEKYNYISSFNFYHKALSESLTNYLHKEGYRTRIWTLNDPNSIPDIIIDGIITDSPNLF